MNLKIRKLVKNKIKETLRILSGFLLLAIVIVGCNEASDLGLEVLPGQDLINVKNITIEDGISAQTTLEESLISSGGVSLLGSFNDPDFGSTNIDFASQFRMSAYPDYDGSGDGTGFGTNPVVDSVTVYLYYKGVYGDTITPQNFMVYELISSLDVDEDYTQDIDLKSMASDKLIGQINYTPKTKIDTTTQDTLYQTIKIPLDISLGEKLVNMDSAMMASNDSFLTVFKGLFIESEIITGELGGLLTLEASASSSFQGSAMVVYYNNDENIAEGAEADTLSYPYIITENSARVNSIEHDYSMAPFQTIAQNENFYVQPTGGLKAFIEIDGLEDWRDSVNTGINRAELVFKIDTIASDIHNFAPPPQLLITFIDDDGDEKLPIDYYFNPNYFGGFLNEDYEYSFNITQHMQRIMDGDVDNNGFYLSTGRRTNYANRVVMEGAGTEEGIQLIVTYSTFLQ
ncbi:MAG: DUF4270 domain-containing protein [Sulfitobacter litoralis]|nr:DUF4270 domain-containing protein [Sulfitobacter litoralis]